MEDDNGYHSNEGEVQTAENVDVPENYLLDDLQYEDDTTLIEPSYEAVRRERYIRNKYVMKSINPRITNYMYGDSDDTSVTMSPEEMAAVKIQKYVRGLLARNVFVRMLAEKFEEDEQLRREKVREQMEEAQLLVENHKLEVQFEDYNVVRRNRLQRVVCSVITIQRAWRRFVALKNASQK